MRTLKQNTARNVLVFMADETDHVTGKTGLTLTITASKAGAAFASISPTVTERTNGWYQLALTASHTDTLGDLALHITGAGADPADILMQVVSHDLSAIGKSAFLATELAIGTVTSQTEFIIPGGPANDIANVMAIFFDASASNSPVVAEGAYTGSTTTLVLTSATGITVTTSDTVTLYAVAANTLGTDAISAAALSAAAVTKIQTGLATPTNITAATGVVLSGVTHTGAVIPTVTTLTGHTAQTGDSFARIGAAGSGLTSLASAANLTIVAGYLDTEIAAILADTNELQADWADGGRLDLLLDTASSGGGLDAAGVRAAVGLASANLDTQLDAIVADTNELQTDWASGGRLESTVLMVGISYTHAGTGGTATATITKA